MNLQTQAMINGAGHDMEVCVGKHKDTGEFHGMLYVNHPTPSGCDRYMLVLSDNRGWPTEEEAEEEFKKILRKDNILKEDEDE